MPDNQGNPSEQDALEALGWDKDEIVIDEDDGTDATLVPTVTTPSTLKPATTPPEDPAVAPISLPVAPPVTPPPPIPSYQQLYEQQQRASVEGQVKDQINMQAGQYKNSLIASGWEETQAHESAKQYATAEWHKHQYAQVSQQQEALAKHTVAQSYATQYGVPFEELLGYSSPQAMEAAAQRHKQQTARIQALETRINEAVKAPVQSFDSGQGAGGNTRQSLLLKYATGGTLTPDQLKQLDLTG